MGERNGGSCIAAQDGSWIYPLLQKKEIVVTATINLNEVRKKDKF
jgi:nitrilase